MRVSDLEKIFRALNEADVEYLVVGGLAVIAHGYNRSTVDVDVVIHLEEANTRRGITALEEAGFRPLVPVNAAQFADAKLRESWRAEKHMIVFQMRHDDPVLPRVDVFVAEPFPFADEYANAFWDNVGDTRVPFVKMERLLQLKRESGRPQDLADVDALETIKANRPSHE